MKSISRPRLISLVFAAFLTGILIAPSLALAGGRPIVIFHVTSMPYGKSYQEWSDAWWQWAYSIPASVNPLFDETGANASQNQSGPVWFLAGVFNVSGSAERTITVPRGKALFFPILNAEWDNLCPVLDPQPAPGDLVNVLKANVTSFIDAVDQLECDLDGTEAPDMFNFRVGPGDPFSVTFPSDNIFQAFGCSNVTPGTYSPLVSGGYYLMLAPLRQGNHTLHFRGHTTFMGSDFTLDITYHIHVGDPPPSGGENMLSAVVPNPFNPQAKLRFTTTQTGPVRVDLFDMSGRSVRVLYQEPLVAAGKHEVSIEGVGRQREKLASGIYFYRIVAKEGTTSGHFVIMK